VQAIVVGVKDQMSRSTVFIDIEDFISKRARSMTNCRYAFSVVLQEEKYRELLSLFKKKDAFLPDNIVKYPWCHLKLITGTYVRAFNSNTDDKGMINLIEKEVGENFRHYWEAIPGILERLNLKRVREERGPWYIYANVVLHAGIPSAYFNELFDITKESYKGCNEDIDRTIEELHEKKDIFKYKRFSKYFKKAFESPTEKKLLFKWLVQLLVIKHRDDHLSFKLFEYLPGHLLNCLETIKVDPAVKESGSRKERKRSTGRGLVFNPDKNRLEYHIPIKEFNLGGGEKVENIPDRWKKALDMAKFRGLPDVLVPVKPGDLLKGITIIGRQIPIFENIPSDSIETIIFDSDYNAIIPGTKEIFINKESESILTIISGNELPDLKKAFGWSFHDDLPGEWWDWYHYEWKTSLMNDVVNFPLPYGEIMVHSKYERKNISGEWLSYVQLQKLSQNLKQFGGDSPPSLKISLKSKSEPLIAAKFSYGNEVIDDRDGKLHYEDGDWIWTSSLNANTLTGSQYNINVNVYDMIPGQSECAGFECVWYPSFDVSLYPGSMLWPDDSCTVRIKTNENLFIHSDIPGIYKNMQSKGNEYSWIFPGKPSDCAPIIMPYTGEHSFDFVLRLPYLSAWVLTKQAHEFDASRLEWKDSGPFARSVLEKVVEKDYNARIRFRLYSRKCKSLYIYESSTNRLIRKLSFEEDGHDSMACLEILKLDTPVIRDEITGKEAYLIEVDEKKWDFREIFEKAKESFLYKNRFYYGAKKGNERKEKGRFK
jgi:hypothetical protein